MRHSLCTRFGLVRGGCFFVFLHGRICIRHGVFLHIPPHTPQTVDSRHAFPREVVGPCLDLTRCELWRMAETPQVCRTLASNAHSVPQVALGLILENATPCWISSSVPTIKSRLNR